MILENGNHDGNDQLELDLIIENSENENEVVVTEKVEIQEYKFKEKTGQEFHSFYKKYYPKLIYYTSKMCPDKQEAEDISTESFIIALQKIDKYDSTKAKFSTWLFIIAKNLTLQKIKDNKKFISIETEVDDEGTTMKDFIPYEESSEIQHTIIAKKSKIMLEYIEKLEQPYRRVIQMRELKKMPYRSIATELNTNENTIKSQIRNARIILRKMVKKEFDQLDNMY
jgi:RNA polymerase sigma-70 factor (ECF subfamily)